MGYIIYFNLLSCSFVGPRCWCLIFDCLNFSDWFLFWFHGDQVIICHFNRIEKLTINNLNLSWIELDNGTYRNRVFDWNLYWFYHYVIFTFWKLKSVTDILIPAVTLQHYRNNASSRDFVNTIISTSQSLFRCDQFKFRNVFRYILLC